MLKSINKKIAFLFLVIASLAWLGAITPMKLDPCERPPTETTLQKLFHRLSCGLFRHTTKKITDLPCDCLCEIFQYFAEHNNPNPTLELMFACKQFKKVIEHYQCFYMGKKKFFHDCYRYSLFFTNHSYEKYDVPIKISPCLRNFVRMEDLFCQYKKDSIKTYSEMCNVQGIFNCIKVYDEKALSKFVNEPFFLNALKNGAIAMVVSDDHTVFREQHLQIRWRNDLGTMRVRINRESLSNKERALRNLAMFACNQTIEVVNYETCNNNLKKILPSKAQQSLSVCECRKRVENNEFKSSKVYSFFNMKSDLRWVQKY